MPTATKNDNGKSEIGGLVLKLSAYIVATLVTVILTMTGFWLMEGYMGVTEASLALWEASLVNEQAISSHQALAELAWQA